MKYDLIVYIGRFQPLHNGHIQTIQTISSLAKKTLVIIGSSTSPITLKNPFTFDERKEMIESSTHVQYISIKGVEDFTYDDNKWITKINELVYDEVPKNAKVAIAGFQKDESSHYLKYFPQWDLIEQKEYKEYGTTIHATDIRENLYNHNLHYIKNSVSTSVFYMLMEMDKIRLEYLINEYKELKRQQNIYGLGPFVTTDAVVIQSGHILLIKRKGTGQDLWALPGGFLNINETIEQCLIRELKEETKLKVPEKVLLGSIKSNTVFDKPDRDIRGRIITHAYLIKLDDNEKLPKVKGNDDAKEARWVPIPDVSKMQSVMYADHFAIIQKMI